MSATLDTSAAMASRPITISVGWARGRPCYSCSADGCVARMESQAARAYMHEIECVERLDVNSLMRPLACADRGTKFYSANFTVQSPS